MSVIELNQLIVLPMLDIIPVEPGAANARPGPSGSFNDYLQRAQTSSAGAGDDVEGDSSGDAPQTPVPRAEELHSTADQPPPRPNSSEDNIGNISGTGSDGKANPPMPESQPPADKNNPVGQGTSVTKTNKEKEVNKKDNHDSAPAGINQGNQLNAHIDSKTGNAKNHSQSGNNTLSIKGEIEDASNPFRAASKDAKTKKSAGSGGLSEAESLTAGAPRTSAADEPDAPLSASGKKKASKKTTLEEDNNAEKPAEAQIIEIAPAAGKGRAAAAKTVKDASASPHDAQGNTANQNGKTRPSTARVADVAVSSVVYQGAPAGAATVNSAALQAAANPPFMATTSAKDKIDPPTTDRPSNIASDSKAADPANALQRLEQPGIKTTASSQGMADDARSDLNGVRFVQRVERAFAAMGDGGGTLRLKLNPPELGSVHMEISVNKGMMKARLEAETKEAKNLILENLPALRDRLAQQNIKIQKFDVDLRDPSSGGMSQQTANQAETGSGDGGYRAPRPQSLENGQSAPPTTDAQRLANHNGQLNVIV
ncbi:MAG: flagellar hook-length control protein FliK [Thermoguttaceae bacterium]